MKIIKNNILSLALFVIILITYGYSKSNIAISENELPKEFPLKAQQELPSKISQTINMFVTHGHCSTPFAGNVYNLEVDVPKKEGLENPLKQLKISFEIDPNSFKVSKGDDLTKRIKTPGLFIGMNNETIKFRSTNVYIMGLDWYQVNGILTIKGVEQEVKLFATGIKESEGTMASSLVLQGQMNLLDWGIDYDLIVNGKSDSNPTKWMYINMKVNMSS